MCVVCVQNILPEMQNDFAQQHKDIQMTNKQAQVVTSSASTQSNIDHSATSAQLCLRNAAQLLSHYANMQDYTVTGTAS